MIQNSKFINSIQYEHSYLNLKKSHIYSSNILEYNAFNKNNLIIYVIIYIVLHPL